jgi:Tol biopolymer transport system component
MRALLLISLLASTFFQNPPAQPSAPPPSTDIHLFALTGGLASLKNAKPVAVSTGAGYDNQPMFSLDGGRVLFAANRDGKQIDIYVFERTSGRVAQLTQTAENENSPTYLPAGLGEPGGFSVVRTEPDKTQRLWRFDAQGRNPQVILTDIKPVGYHAWVDAKTVALFVLGPPSTLQIASVESGKGEIAAEAIERSLHRVPGSRSVSFVQRDPSGDFWIKQVDTTSKKIEPLVKVPDANAGSSERDMAWMPDGQTILLSSGTKVVSWTRGAAGWTEVLDTAAHGLGTPTRLAVAPKADALAIVVAEPKK